VARGSTAVSLGIRVETLNFTELVAAEVKVRQALRRAALAAGGSMFPLDFLAWAAAKRTAALTHAFILLLEADNYSTAGALVRLQLDTALRFRAAWLVDDPHDFAMKVLSGTRVDRLRHRNGKRLTDSLLASDA